MQDSRLFEYAVIRVVPRVEREEFLNVGVILYARKTGFLEVKFYLDKQKLLAFFPELPIDDIAEHLLSFEKICKGTPDSGPIGALDPASRFRWLTATRSTVVQTSKVHPGFCEHPADALKKLFQQLVM
jgi:hypothetical protein